MYKYMKGDNMSLGKGLRQYSLAFKPESMKILRSAKAEASLKRVGEIIDDLCSNDARKCKSAILLLNKIKRRGLKK